MALFCQYDTQYTWSSLNSSTYLFWGGVCSTEKTKVAGESEKLKATSLPNAYWCRKVDVDLAYACAVAQYPWSNLDWNVLSATLWSERWTVWIGRDESSKHTYGHLWMVINYNTVQEFGKISVCTFFLSWFIKRMFICTEEIDKHPWGNNYS